MPRLSQPAIDRCANVAFAIDEELAKDPHQRKSLFIRTSNPKTFKAELAEYKTKYKPQWKGQFWMFVHDGRTRGKGDHPLHGRCIEIDFTQEGNKKVAFEVVREGEMQVEVFREDIGHISPSSFTMTAPQQLDDSTAAQFILIEAPLNLKLDLSYLDKRTLDYIEDSINNEPSPLINMLIKRGYAFERRGSFLWVFRGDS